MAYYTLLCPDWTPPPPPPVHVQFSRQYRSSWPDTFCSFATEDGSRYEENWLPSGDGPRLRATYRCTSHGSQPTVRQRWDAIENHRTAAAHRIADEVTVFNPSAHDADRIRQINPNAIPWPDSFWESTYGTSRRVWIPKRPTTRSLHSNW